MKFVGLVGSNYDQSYNRKLLEFIRRNFKFKFELEVLEIDEVPMFNPLTERTVSFSFEYDMAFIASVSGRAHPADRLRRS